MQIGSPCICRRSKCELLTFISGTNGCWTRVDSGSSRLEPLGASQKLKLDNVIYQEAGEYRCIASSKESTKRLDTLRSAMSVHLTVTGKSLILI